VKKGEPMKHPRKKKEEKKMGCGLPGGKRGKEKKGDRQKGPPKNSWVFSAGKGYAAGRAKKEGRG